MLIFVFVKLLHWNKNYIHFIKILYKHLLANSVLFFTKFTSKNRNLLLKYRSQTSFAIEFCIAKLATYYCKIAPLSAELTSFA